MKFGLKEIPVHMGAFDFTVICIIGKYKNVRKYVEWKFETSLPDGWLDVGYEPRGKYFFKMGYVPVIWIPRYPKTSREHATLAHESLHAAYRLIAWTGMPITDDTEEVMTHSMAHIINTVLGSKKK